MVGRSGQPGLSDFCIDLKLQLFSAIWNRNSSWRSLKNQRLCFQIISLLNVVLTVSFSNRDIIFSASSWLPVYTKKGIYKLPQSGMRIPWCVLGRVNTGKFRLPTMALPMFCAAGEWASLDVRITEMHPGRQDLYGTPEVGLFDLLS